MFLRCSIRSGGIDPFLRLPLSRLPSSLPAKRTSSTRQPEDAHRPHAKKSQPSGDDKNNSGGTRPPSDATPLERFFSQFHEFQHQPSFSPFVEFNRLCKEYKWGKFGPKKENARDGFNLAIKKQFDKLYGSDVRDVKNWRRLCHVLKIDPVPSTLQACRNVVLTKHVNLVDLLEYLLVKGDEKEVKIFGTERDLSVYTRNAPNKIFPKEDARDGGVLRALRRHIFDPQDDPPRKRPSKFIHHGNGRVPRIGNGVGSGRDASGPVA